MGSLTPGESGLLLLLLEGGNLGIYEPTSLRTDRIMTYQLTLELFRCFCLYISKLLANVEQSSPGWFSGLWPPSSAQAPITASCVPTLAAYSVGINYLGSRGACSLGPLIVALSMQDVMLHPGSLRLVRPP